MSPARTAQPPVMELEAVQHSEQPAVVAQINCSKSECLTLLSALSSPSQFLQPNTVKIVRKYTTESKLVTTVSTSTDDFTGAQEQHERALV